MEEPKEQQPAETLNLQETQPATETKPEPPKAKRKYRRKPGPKPGFKRTKKTAVKAEPEKEPRIVRVAGVKIAACNTQRSSAGGVESAITGTPALEQSD